MLAAIEPVLVDNITKFNVTTESHPTEFTKVSKYEPATVRDIPLNK